MNVPEIVIQPLEGNCNLYSGNFNCLLKKVKNLEKAHRKCRGINKKMDTILNIFILLTSAAVTSLESLLDVTKHEYQVTIAKVVLSGITTFLAGLNMTFDNAAKSSTHHEVSRLYMQLGINIEKAMLIKDQTKYKQLLDEYSEIRKDSIGLFGFVRKQYQID